MQLKEDSFRNSLPRFWSIICVVNLLIGSLLGLFMRYKIVFPFRALSQDHTLYAHYNFMFVGWVSLTLFSCIIAFVLPEKKSRNRFYTFAYFFMEFAAVGMLVSFFLQGYGSYSISFSILSLLSGMFFVVKVWIDSASKALSTGIRLFLRGAMLWYLLSFVGVIMIVKYMTVGGGSPFQKRAALYYFLHFQYNGWFTFCIFTLLLSWLRSIRRPLPSRPTKVVFWLFAVGLIPGYGLSILAFYPFLWVELASVFSVITDFTAAIILIKIILKVYQHINIKISKMIKVLWIIATLSFFVKVVMQAATLVPSLASFAFSFRPLVIGFLHLTFLCFVTFFLMGYLLYFNRLQIKYSQITKWGLSLFVIMVILSEMALFTQSFFAFIGIYLFVINYYLFWITVGIFLGLLGFVFGQWKHREKLTFA